MSSPRPSATTAATAGLRSARSIAQSRVAASVSSTKIDRSRKPRRVASVGG